MPSIHFQAEHSWEGLLQRIENREVVPVIGPDLLLTEIAGKKAHFYKHLTDALLVARGLAVADLKLPSEAVGACSLDAIFRAVRPEERQDLREELAFLVSRLAEQAAPPEPLQQLAQIDRFDLFVSTTFDPLLERTLNEVRFSGDHRTHRRSYALGLAGETQPAPIGETTVFQMLGRTAAWASFAVTEEVGVEFISSIQTAGSLRWLFDRLKGSHLLLLGNSYPDWLGRFFLRLAKSQRLSEARQRVEIVADDAVRTGSSFTEFLQSFSGETRIYQGGALEFVRQLHTRWMARATRFAPKAGGPISLSGVKSSGGPSGSEADDSSGSFVFLSYAREDQVAVRHFHAELKAAHLKAWFDEDSVQAGDPWNDLIREKIWKCALFVPFFSRHTMARRQGVFWRECNMARDRFRDMDRGTVFIVPVVIDDSGSDAVPHDFHAHHIAHLPDGQPDPGFVRRLIQQVRDFERTAKGRALRGASQLPT